MRPLRRLEKLTWICHFLSSQKKKKKKGEREREREREKRRKKKKQKTLWVSGD
jgi:hypothetical protein